MADDDVVFTMTIRFAAGTADQRIMEIGQRLLTASADATWVDLGVTGVSDNLAALFDAVDAINRAQEKARSTRK